MPTYTYFCEKCQEVTDGFFRLTENRPEVIACQVCKDEVAKYRLSLPMHMKASYLDGQRREAWKDLREASKLNVAASATDNQEEKKELLNEAKKIGYNFKKEGA